MTVVAMFSENVFIFIFSGMKSPSRFCLSEACRYPASEPFVILKLNRLNINEKPLSFRTQNAALCVFLVGCFPSFSSAMKSVQYVECLLLLLKVHAVSMVYFHFSQLNWTEPWSCWKSNLMFLKIHKDQWKNKHYLFHPWNTHFVPLHIIPAGIHGGTP